MAGEDAGMPKLLTPAETAAILRVTQRTLGFWAIEGKIGVMYLPSGQRRYYEAEVRAIAEGRERKE